MASALAGTFIVTVEATGTFDVTVEVTGIFDVTVELAGVANELGARKGSPIGLLLLLTYP